MTLTIAEWASHSALFLPYPKEEKGDEKQNTKVREGGPLTPLMIVRAVAASADNQCPLLTAEGFTEEACNRDISVSYMQSHFFQELWLEYPHPL